MARIPNLKRLLAEDFKDQPWISKLLSVLNSFFESTVAALNKGLSFQDNVDCEIRSVTLDGTFPVKITLQNTSPIGWYRINLQRSNGASFTLPAAFDFVISYTQTGVQIDSVVGITPTPSEKYIVKLVFLNS